MQTKAIEQLIATPNFKLHKANKKVKCMQYNHLCKPV